MLAGSEGHHAATVRRLRVGERVDIADGVGSVAECVVMCVRRGELDCQVLRHRTEPAPSPRLVVVQALAKADRGERAVEMLTEVGVDEVVPWAAERSVVRWDGERGGRARLRWCTAAVEAAKQSRRMHWPTVAELASTEDVVARLAATGLAIVLHEHATRPLGELLRTRRDEASDQTSGQSGEIVLVVGPEGSLADAELGAFAAVGARSARLGPTVLRTSTAGVVAAAVVLADVGRWDG
jgi:16S rRNA (uracil1498-N3)-methyltransferase